mmetsp:Transcript_89763/g.134532  ORF Transcript_89763/g.134532 Transcript_89763/m.134532 type:complete len:84 (-) Transcript_89763:174-425(-)
MNMGTKSCDMLTPKFPIPPLIPRQYPCWDFGNKKLMLLIELAKAPPPVPLSHAATNNKLNGVVGEFKAHAVSIMAAVSMILAW